MAKEIAMYSKLVSSTSDWSEKNFSDGIAVGNVVSFLKDEKSRLTRFRMSAI